MDIEHLENPALYINRELSQLAFNYRVLAQTLDDTQPLLERLRYLFICSSNLDEFFEIRVAGLKQQVAFGSRQVTYDGLHVEEVLHRVNESAHAFYQEQYRILNQVLFPALEKERIYMVSHTQWTEEQAAWIKHYFRTEILPVLTPIALDVAHPFPRLVNKSLNFVVSLDGKDAFGRESGLAIIHAPRTLDRIIRLPSEISGSGDHFIFLSSIIDAHADDLFPGMNITGCYQFRLTRNSELFVTENSMDDLVHTLKGKLFARRFGEVVRLEVVDYCPERICNFLLRKCNIRAEFLYRTQGPVNLQWLSVILNKVHRPSLHYPSWAPAFDSRLMLPGNIFNQLKHESLLLHHPYESFQGVEEFVRQATQDHRVLAIKITLYRTESDSTVIDELVSAARAGIEVTAVIELRARFDEEENIALANRLQEAGALVVYGVVGYKTHAKMTLVVRREQAKLVRYVHLGTGNYHHQTAKQYVDLSFFTGDTDITTDIHYVFQQLTGMGRATKLKKILHAPFSLHKALLDLIVQEIQHARAGFPAKIIIKINALSEKSIIRALYEASQAGVEIDLIVRGICCLRPGIPGVSERIRVRSIIGRFLEHSRVYYFYNKGEEKVYLASADLMERNLFHRVEIAFPVEDKKLIARLKKEVLELLLGNNRESWLLQSDGTYHPHPMNTKTISVHQTLINRLSESE